MVCTTTCTGGARPSVGGESHVTGAASLTLAGLQFRELVVQDVPGRVTITDCVIGQHVITEQTFLREIAFRPKEAEEFRQNQLRQIGKEAMTRKEALEKLGWK